MANVKNDLKKRCIVCGKLRSPTSYYVSRSSFHADGRLPVCVKCMNEFSLDDDGQDIDIKRFQKLLQQCDKPYLDKLWRSAVVQTENKYPDKKGADKVKTEIGMYMKNLNGLIQYQQMDWEDSDFDFPQEETAADTDGQDIDDHIIVSDDGYEYTAPQYEAMLALYRYLDSVYQFPPNSTEHELLKIYAALRLQSEADAAIGAVTDYHAKESAIHDILTALHWGK